MLDEHTIDDPWYALAEQIKDARNRLGMSRQDLATRIGVSRGTILNWESGRRVPIEKCAQLADALQINTDALLKLHPEVPSGDRQLGSKDEDGRGFRISLREVALMGFGVLSLVIGVGFLASSTASNECFAVGAGLGTAGSPFRSAYDAAGGRADLGCPSEEVRKWGDGVSQTLAGGTLGTGVILSLDRRNANVISGQLFQDWRWTADGAAADVAGYPAGPPVSCDGTIVLPLTSGAAGPGAMVQRAGGSSYVWIHGDIWIAYAAVGGPTGSLGRPTEKQTGDDNSQSANFEGGSILARYGAAPVTNGGQGAALSLEACSSVPH
ncbi:MAG TPA: XRE family transcriptional regulator, partial [Actinobacteria bacterium]|nr:XRE family transcriptional regulator [Actinomycetota bacterium]